MVCVDSCLCGDCDKRDPLFGETACAGVVGGVASGFSLIIGKGCTPIKLLRFPGAMPGMVSGRWPVGRRDDQQ